MKATYGARAGVLVLASALIGPALAERGEPSYYSRPSFLELDVDADNVLSPGEVQGYTPLYSEWNRMDANGDGVLEPSEFAAFEVVPPTGPADAPSAGDIERAQEERQ